jgi:hypothetical protein
MRAASAGDGVEVAGVPGDRVRPGALGGQLGGESVQGFRAAGDERDGVPRAGVAAGDGLAEPRPRPDDGDRSSHNLTLESS